MKSPRIQLVKGERSPFDHAQRMEALKDEPSKAAPPAPPSAAAPAAPTLASLAAEVALLRQAVEGLVAMQRLGLGAAPTASESESESADLLYGVPAIAAFLNMRERQCRHRVDMQTLPTFRMGSIICARPSSLREWISAQEAAR